MSPDLFPPKLFPASSLVPFKAGESIFKEGEHGDVMYVLFEGMAEVFVGDRSVGLFEPIEVFGEMSILDSAPRSATVVAKTDCKLASVNRARFLLLLKTKPEFSLHVMERLIERIRWMNEAARSREGEFNGETERLRAQISQLAGTPDAEEELAPA